MPAPTTMRIAFLGCGYAAKLHAGALKGITGIECVYASRDAAKARDFSSRLGGAGAFGSYEAALESPDVDVALILTPPPQHLPLALAALAAGKHVVVEKPPFLRSSDFDVVEEAERTSGRRVLIAENYFYKPLVQTLRRLIAGGAIGQVRYLVVNAMKEQQTSGWRAQAEESGGGAFYEGGIHWMNFMTSLGLMVTEAEGLCPAPAAVPERSLLATFRYAEGAVGVLLHAWDAPSPLKGLRVSRIYGTEGSIALESNGLIVGVWGRRPRVLVPGLLRDLTGRGAMWRDFVTSLRTGQAPGLTLAHVRRDLELVESVYASVANRAYHSKGEPHE